MENVKVSQCEAAVEPANVKFDRHVQLQMLSATTLNGSIGNVLGEALNGRLAVFVPMENKRKSLRPECLRPLSEKDVAYYQAYTTHWKASNATLVSGDRKKFHETQQENNRCTPLPQTRPSHKMFNRRLPMSRGPKIRSTGSPSIALIACQLSNRKMNGFSKSSERRPSR